VSRQASEGHLKEQIPARRHFACAGFKFCLANLAAELAPLFIWAHLRVPMAQFMGKKSSTSCSRQVEGTPDEGKTACRTGRVLQMDCEVGGWRSGVIRSAADPSPKKAGHSHDVRLPRGDACAVAGNLGQAEMAQLFLPVALKPCA
jgi:hypothetical protein